MVGINIIHTHYMKAEKTCCLLGDILSVIYTDLSCNVRFCTKGKLLVLSNCGSIKVKYLRLNVTRVGKVR